MRAVLKKLYWVVRILAYAVTLPATFVYLYARFSDPVLAERAMYGIGAGFVFFFVSYAIRIALRTMPAAGGGGSDDGS